MTKDRDKYLSLNERTAAIADNLEKSLRECDEVFNKLYYGVINTEDMEGMMAVIIYSLALQKIHETLVSRLKRLESLGNDKMETLKSEKESKH